MIKKLTVLLVFLLLFIAFVFPSTSYLVSKPAIHKETDEVVRPIPVQDKEKEGEKKESDSHFILLLKQISEKLGSWLKSLNEKIESEDITRFEVRFYEILRSILEWVKEKIDAKIKSSEGQKPEKKDTRIFRKTV